jgi:carbamoyl-phosphate synthase/aspartate carbamoyltransferase/dihydroorotase
LRTLTEDPNSWKGASFLSVSQITAPGLHKLFQVSQEMKELVSSKGGDQRLDKRVLATVFYEASTRTACSFQAAMMRLGGTYLHVDGHGNTSAGKKGETLEDTILCMQCYADVAVLRHPVQGSVGKAIAVSEKPIINAGDGIGEHPTQALLDVYTIYDELKLSLQVKKPLTVVLLGDLKNGRTVHSLAKLLVTSDVWADELTLRYCAPPGLSMPGYIQAYVEENCPNGSSVRQEMYTDLSSACQGADVLYVTRIQKERFDYPEEYEKVKVRTQEREKHKLLFQFPQNSLLTFAVRFFVTLSRVATLWTGPS